MGLFSKDIQTMEDLFLHTLRDIYYAENKIVNSLPDIIDMPATPSSSRTSKSISTKPKATCSDSNRCSKCLANPLGL